MLAAPWLSLPAMACAPSRLCACLRAPGVPEILATDRCSKAPFAACPWRPGRGLAALSTFRVPVARRPPLWTFLRSTDRCSRWRRHTATMAGAAPGFRHPLAAHRAAWRVSPPPGLAHRVHETARFALPTAPRNGTEVDRKRWQTPVGRPCTSTFASPRSSGNGSNGPPRAPLIPPTGSSSSSRWRPSTAANGPLPRSKCASRGPRCSPPRPSPSTSSPPAARKSSRESATTSRPSCPISTTIQPSPIEAARRPTRRKTEDNDSHECRPACDRYPGLRRRVRRPRIFAETHARP